MSRSTVYPLLVVGGVIFAFLISIGIVVLVRDPGVGNVELILAAATLGMAVATVEVAIVALVSMYQGQKQATEALYALNRPILVPRSDFTAEEPFDWNVQGRGCDIQNAGNGVALNVFGVIFPPAALQSQPRYWTRPPFPILSHKRANVWFEQGGTLLSRHHQIGPHPLFVPDDRAPEQGVPNFYRRGPRCQARLTLTYTDIFGRRHASIFDYTIMHKWECVAILDDIPQTLDEMDRDIGRIQAVQSGNTDYVAAAGHPAHDDLAELGL